jgi:hypothetical protein
MYGEKTIFTDALDIKVIAFVFEGLMTGVTQVILTGDLQIGLRHLKTIVFKQ